MITDRRVINKIQDLTAVDFPERVIKFRIR